MIPVILLTALLTAGLLLYVKLSLDRAFFNVYEERIHYLFEKGYRWNTSAFLDSLCRQKREAKLYGNISFYNESVCIYTSCTALEDVNCSITGENKSGLITLRYERGGLVVG